MKKFISLILIFLGITLNAQPLEFQGKITTIKDGDTFKVLYQQKEYTIRLAHMIAQKKIRTLEQKPKNTPLNFVLEKKQPLNTRAKKTETEEL